MNLLEDIALFDEGRKRFTNFQLPDTDNGYAWTDVPLEIKARVEGEYGTRLFKVRHKTRERSTTAEHPVDTWELFTDGRNHAAAL